MKLEKQIKNETIPVNITQDKTVKGIFLGEKEITSDKYGGFKVLEFQKENKEKVSLIKYTDLRDHDWDSYIGKNVVVELIGQRVNEITNRTQYIFSVFVENELEYPKYNTSFFIN